MLLVRKGLDEQQGEQLPGSMHLGRLVSHRQVWVTPVQQQDGRDVVPDNHTTGCQTDISQLLQQTSDQT